MTANDSDQLRRHYASDSNLRVRHETHHKYTIPERSFVEWALSCYGWRGNERVLDVGCGPGLYYRILHQMHPDIDYTGLDYYTGMVRNHPANPGLVLQGDAANLPLPENAYDVVMANHMLFHIQDIEGAIREFRRVLKPGGVLMVATNSVQTMPELQVLLRRAIVLLTRQGAAQVRAPSLPSDRFALENGTRALARYFYAVVRHDLPSQLVFPEVEPAMTYLESTRDLRESQLPDDVTWEDVMMIMRQQINQIIKHLGELAISKLSGVLMASDEGGFIAPYVDIERSSAEES